MNRLITLEGPEGAGKTTVLAEIDSHLRQAGHTVVCTREPGAAFSGEVRRLLLLSGHVAPQAELFLFLADRAQHVAEVIRPALDRGAFVLCDRFADSTVVYQGHARGFDLGSLREWNRFATDGLTPGLTLLLDLPPEVGLSRLRTKDRLDAESMEFHQRVRDGFLAEAALDPERWVTIDASQPADRVATDAVLAVMERYDL